jgi:hypothetical protein
MSLSRPNRLRRRDYTRGAPANQLDDGIGDTFVSGPAEQSTHRSVPVSPTHTLVLADTFVQ